MFVLHVCMRRLPDSYYSGSFVFAPFHAFHCSNGRTIYCRWLRWEERLRLTGRLHLRWQSVLTPVIKECHLLRTTPRPTTASTTPRLALRLATTRQPSWSNYTSRSTRLPLRHYCATTLPTLNSSLLLHLKSINYSPYNKQLHFRNLTTHYPFTASQETSGRRATIPHCSASHYLKQPMCTTTTQHQCALQLATTTPTSLFNYRLNNDSF